MFTIGEKVRMLHDIHEGVVLKIKDRGIIEIETTEGFIIPVLARELVKIHGMERTEALPNKIIQAIPIKKQFGIGLEKISLNRFRLYLINDTPNNMVGTLSFKKQGSYFCYSSFQIDSHASKQVLGQFEMESFEDWNRLQLQILSYQVGKEASKHIEVSCTLKASKIVQSETLIPMLKLPGFFTELDLSPKEEIKPNTTIQCEKTIKLEKLEIDLHAEKLGLHTETLDFLDVQFKEFLKAFDRCIHEEIPKLVVVHGIGKGILKNKIHQFLAENEKINHFKDAQKEKFGFGATEITFV